MNTLRLPIVAAFLAFLAGLLAGLRIDAVPAGAALAAGLPIAALLLHRPVLGVAPGRRTRHGCTLAALVLAGAGDGAQARIDAASDCRAVLQDGARLVVAGALAADFVAPRDSAERTPLLPLAVQSAAGGRGGTVPGCRVEMRVRLPRGTPAVAAGANIRLSGEWRLLPSPVDPGRWPRSPAYRGYLLARTASVTAPPSFAEHPLLSLRGRAERQIRRLFPRNAALADALVLGRRETLDRGVADRFAASGLVHLLAISGTHVALVAAVLVLLGRVVRLRRNATAWLTILLVALYLGMIGAPPSAVRSGIMTALALLTVVLQRPTAPMAIVSAAALAILAMDPMAALDAGFQLSFAGVLGIMLLRRPLLERVPARLRRGKAKALAEACVVSVAAFAATAPVTAHHFGQVAPIAIVANLPAIPVSSLALVGIGAACAVEPAWPGLARLVADGASLALDAMQRIVDVAAAVPGGHASVARPRWWLWAAAALAVVAALQWSAGMRRRVRWALAPMAAGAAFLLLPLAAAPARGLEIAFLDVGQGDAIAIHTPADRWLLVDAGPWDEDFDAGHRRVMPWLRAHGARRVEALVVTHPHLDHLGGAPAVLREIPVERLIDPGLAFGTPMYRELLHTARARHVAWNAARQGRVMRIDGVELRFLWPTADVLDAPEDANDISAVIQLRYGGFSALLTGDAPAFVEHALVGRYGAGLRSQLLKAGHHGSRTATSQELLEAVHPALAVISCGRRNKYGHPAPETMARLRADQVQVARTDEDGTVVVRVAPGGRSWEREEG
jgi:competence protein ComEC